MRYYTPLNVLLLQSYGLSKLAVKKKSRPFGFEAIFYVVVHGRILAKIIVLKVHKLWAPTAPIPLAQNECLVPHLKDPIHIFLDLEAQRYSTTFRAICKRSNYHSGAEGITKYFSFL